jgi:hypothetical protein
MCGDLEEDQRFGDQLYARFRLHARELLPRGAEAPAPTSAEAAPRDANAYMDKLFADALARCARDSDGAEDPYELLRLQPLVFARLAGFLAAHVALQEDPLRKVMEALMHGYAEAEHIERDHHGHDHDHEHGHGHHQHPGHGHGHDHHH